MSSDSKPLSWIQLELIPLPNYIEKYSQLLIWWSPETGELIGEVESDVSMVQSLVAEAMKTGSISSPLSAQFELTEPLKKPSELAAILGQFFWVVPQPVEQPLQRVEDIESLGNTDSDHTLQ